MPIMDWHFPVSRNMNELCEQIIKFDLELFMRRMSDHHRELQSFETGTAIKSVIELIDGDLN